jgi:hypothetical protein
MQTAKREEPPELDEDYWREAIGQRGYYRADVGFDRYRWALRYGQLAKRLHGPDVQFEDLIAELAAGWEKFGGPSNLSWEEARDAISDSWHFTDSLLAETIASRAGFESAPTFIENKGVVPRNVDESNI